MEGQRRGRIVQLDCDTGCYPNLTKIQFLCYNPETTSMWFPTYEFGIWNLYHDEHHFLIRVYENERCLYNSLSNKDVWKMV